MGKRIVVVGAGEIGGYSGGHMARAGHHVTLIDACPKHVEYMRSHGLQLSAGSGRSAARRRQLKGHHQSLGRALVDTCRQRNEDNYEQACRQR